MVKKIQTWFAALVFVFVAGGSLGTVVVATPALAACQERLPVLNIPAWYRGLVDGSCEIKKPASNKNGLSKFIWTIALNIIEMALWIIGYISAGFLIYGGYLYMIGAGAADKIVSAKKTITNAIIGLVLSFFSVAIVNIIVGSF